MRNGRKESVHASTLWFLMEEELSTEHLVPIYHALLAFVGYG